MNEIISAGVNAIPQCISDSLNVIDSLINTYKECKLSSAYEESRRVAIRQQTKLYICKLENDTKLHKKEIEGKKEIAFKLIDTLNNLLSQKDIIDDNTMQVCQILIEKAVGVYDEKK